MPDDEREAAYHESGHAVAHLELRLPLRWVTIVPDQESVGGVMGGPLPKSVNDWVEGGGYPGLLSLATRDRLEREVISIMAGEVAQKKATGTTEGSAAYYDHSTAGQVIVGGDWHRIIEVVSWLCCSDREIGPYCDWLQVRTEQLLDRPTTWAVVEAVAKALIERKQLSGRQVREIRRATLEKERAWMAKVEVLNGP